MRFSFSFSRAALGFALASGVLFITPAAAQTTAPGVVEPITGERVIGSQVIGVIREMRVTEGEQVAEGQVVAITDNGEQVAGLASAQAELALRRAELDRVVNGARIEERREASSNLKEAESNLELARSEHQRRLPLVRSGAASQAQLDITTSNLAAAEARRAVMMDRLGLLQAGSREEDIASARARVALGEANVAMAQAQLDKTIIRSPIAGVVLHRHRAAGEAVTNVPPTPIAIVGDLRRLRVRAEVNENDIGRIAVGQRVEATSDALPDRRVNGVVTRIAQRVAGRTLPPVRGAADGRVVEVFIDLDAETAQRLPVGLRVAVQFIPASR